MSFFFSKGENLNRYFPAYEIIVRNISTLNATSQNLLTVFLTRNFSLQTSPQSLSQINSIYN